MNPNHVACSYLVLSARGAFVDWTESTAPDLSHYDVWISSRPGGPYSRLNSEPIFETEWVTPELRFGTFWVVVTASDRTGNVSLQSNEVKLMIE